MKGQITKKVPELTKAQARAMGNAVGGFEKKQPSKKSSNKSGKKK